MDKVFIDVEVDASVAGDAALAAKLEEVCPVDIFKAADCRGRDRRGEPRRVRALQPLRRRGAPRRGSRDQALRALIPAPPPARSPAAATEARLLPGARNHPLKQAQGCANLCTDICSV